MAFKSGERVSRIAGWLGRLSAGIFPGDGDNVMPPSEGSSEISLKCHLSANSGRDPYRGVVGVFLLAAFLGTSGTLFAWLKFGNPVLLNVAVTVGLSFGALFGVALTQVARAIPPKADEVVSIPIAEGEAGESAQMGLATSPEISKGSKVVSRLSTVSVRTWHWFRDLGVIRIVSVGICVVGVLVSSLVSLVGISTRPLSLMVAVVTGACFLIAAGLAAMGARYLANVDTKWLPEGPALGRWARVVAWILVLGASAMGFHWARQYLALVVLYYFILAINLTLCFGFLKAMWTECEGLDVFPIDFRVLSILGNRTNVLASVLDSAERQLGIDLRSTWALTVVRSSLEPLGIGLILIGWLSTSMTVVGIQEQGLVERLGVVAEGPPLLPGLHFHWPWPVDKVFRIPVQKMHALEVGHEGEEGGGPEDVLWAVEHAPNEYTLLLGNGRDLITVDAAVQYRIVDPRAWRYQSQNPADTLRAIAYRAVMRSTVSRTLSQTLSENLKILTEEMRKQVQDEARALGLGVDVVGFTVGGMHPPVAVAADYERVVSAKWEK